MANVAEDQADPIAQSSAADALSRIREHRLRAIDAEQRHPGAAEWSCDTTRAASELEDRSAGLPRKISPELDVATAEGARVLPIIEGRVVVPAFEAFGWRPVFTLPGAACSVRVQSSGFGSGFGVRCSEATLTHRTRDVEPRPRTRNGEANVEVRTRTEHGEQRSVNDHSRCPTVANSMVF